MEDSRRSNKPEVYLWFLGEDAYKAEVLASIKDETTIESEQRRYTLLPHHEETTQATGVLLVFGATQTITPKLKAQLLLSSRFTNNIFVILTDCELLKTEKALDQTERNLRRNLSEQGFDGDSATILQLPKRRPAKEEVARLLTKLDELSGLLSAQPEKPKSFPKSHPNAPLAKVLMQLRSFLAPAARLALTRSTTEKLYTQPISTQVGGMPYLERKEKWPKCERCKPKVPLRFLWQIDARALSGGTLGFYTIYFCDQHTGLPEDFVVKYYKEPSPEKRQPICKEASLPLSITNAVVSPFEVKMIPELQGPPRRSLQDKKYGGLWSSLKKSNPKRKPQTLYTELLDALGAVEGCEISSLSTPYIGGIFEEEWGNVETPVCGACSKQMLVLALIPSPFDAEPDVFYEPEIFCSFVCPCTPEKVTLFLYNEYYTNGWE